MTDFSADRPKHQGKKKELVFKEEKIRSLDKKFNVNLEITVGTESHESHESNIIFVVVIPQIEEIVRGVRNLVITMGP